MVAQLAVQSSPFLKLPLLNRASLLKISTTARTVESGDSVTGSRGLGGLTLTVTVTKSALSHKPYGEKRKDRLRENQAAFDQ